MNTNLRKLADRVLAIRALLNVLYAHCEQLANAGDEPAWREVRTRIVTHTSELEKAESELLEAVLVAADPDQPLPYVLTEAGRQAVKQ